MSESAQTLPNFLGLANFSREGTLDEQLRRMAGMTAAMLDAEHCSIMLADDAGRPDARLTVWASTGAMPLPTDQESDSGCDGVAARVLAGGEAVRIDDIADSRFADCARRPDDPRRSLLCAPIRMHADPLGVVNVSGRHAAGAFNADDLRLLEVIALFIGKAIQVSQLESMLDSRFAQMAVIQETTRGFGASLAAGLPNPDQVAKIMAKSFYKEMTRAGFGSRQIINAASEIITQLSGNLQRHSRRLGRDGVNSENNADSADSKLDGERMQIPGEARSGES